MADITLDTFATLLDHENMTEKLTFGMPALFVNGKMFLSITREGVAYKLSGDALDNALRYTGAQIMPKKSWVEVPFEAGADWMELAEQSYSQVSVLPAKVKKSKRQEARSG